MLPIPSTEVAFVRGSLIQFRKGDGWLVVKVKVKVEVEVVMMLRRVLKESN